MNKKFEVRLPLNIVVDVFNVPDDFEETIKEAFGKYTRGTADEYTYYDKLHFIDQCRESLHHAEDSEVAVMDLVSKNFEESLKSDWEIKDKDDFYSLDFMVACFDAGRTNLDGNYSNDLHVNEAIMQMLIRVIKVVIDYQDEEMEFWNSDK